MFQNSVLSQSSNAKHCVLIKIRRVRASQRRNPITHRRSVTKQEIVFLNQTAAKICSLWLRIGGRTKPEETWSGFSEVCYRNTTEETGFASTHDSSYVWRADDSTMNTTAIRVHFTGKSCTTMYTLHTDQRNSWLACSLYYRLCIAVRGIDKDKFKYA